MKSSITGMSGLAIERLFPFSTNVKRLMDICGSLVGLSFSSPILAIAALAVKVDSQGPILFRSIRVGIRGKPILLYKLRTMHVHEEGSGPEVTASTDDRITRVGKILRKVKIDELPQLINVLKGELSLVGPRPEVPRYVKRYLDQYKVILSVKPGLSDHATLEFVGEEEILAGSEDPEKTYIEEIMPRKIEHYLRYVEKHSIRGDLGIIVQTAIHVVKRAIQSTRGKI